MTNPGLHLPESHSNFGMLTNGDEMLFVKVAPAQYILSRVFSPFVAKTELVTVLKILRQFGSGYEVNHE